MRVVDPYRTAEVERDPPHPLPVPRYPREPGDHRRTTSPYDGAGPSKTLTEAICSGVVSFSAKNIPASIPLMRCTADPLRPGTEEVSFARPDHGHGAPGVMDQPVTDRAEPGTAMPASGHHHEIRTARRVHERLDRMAPDDDVGDFDLRITGLPWREDLTDGGTAASASSPTSRTAYWPSGGHQA